MPQNPNPVYMAAPGGEFNALNIASVGVIKTGQRTLFRLTVNAPGSAGTLTVNDTNNLLTAQTITGITQATSGVVTVSTGGGSNPFTVGNTIAFQSIVGMTQLNGLSGRITAIGGVTTAWTATFSINTTAFTAWASGGTATGAGIGNQILTVPFGSLTSGQVINLDWPCINGIAVSVIPTGGLIAIAYT